LSIDFFGNYDRIKNDYDGTFDNTGFNDTDANITTSEQVRFGFSPKYTYKKGEFILNSGFTKITRAYNELNTFSNTTDYSVYDSRSIVIDAFNKYNINKEWFVILGANYQYNDMNSNTPFSTIENENTKFNIIDGYTTLVYNSDFGLNINAGARLNNHSAYGNNLVYNIIPSYHFKTSFPLKVIASYSTAFVTPSLYQLYSEYGNANLTPEKNTTVEAGFETELVNRKVKLNAVAFYRDQTNAIDFYFDPVTFDAFYVNVNGESKAKGLETSLNIALTSKWQLNGNYTFTKVDKALDRLIPKHKVNASIGYQPTSRTFLNLDYQYFNARNDVFFDGASFGVITTQLNSYQLVNASIKFELIKNRMTIFGAATNLFNEEFVENIGYSTRGRNFRIGLNILL
jgi:vitamin B12 transporter